MDKLLDAYRRMPNLHLRLIIAATALVLGIIIGLTTGNPHIAVSIGYMDPAAIVFFIGAYIVTIVPEFHPEPEPDVAVVAAPAGKPAKRPPTNVQRARWKKQQKQAKNKTS